MKKILHIPNYFYPHIGGIEQTARDIVNSLMGDYEQKIICFNHEKGTTTDLVDGIEVTRVNCQANIFSQSIALKYGKVLKKIIKGFSPDIVIFHYPNPFVAHFLLPFLKKKKFRFILYWHLDITKQKIVGKLFDGQNKKLLRYSDKIITTSPNYIEGSPWLKSYTAKCEVIPSCINDDRLKYNDANLINSKEIRNKYLNKKICFAFGRHVEYKGLSYLIKASKLLNDDYVIFIGGTGPLTDTLKKEAEADKKVIFLGRLTDDELKEYLLACDVFCFPSITKNEAFGLGLAEAMYFAKPVITFHIYGSGVNYVSLKNITGLEVENKNFTKYSEAIITLGNDINLRETYGINAKQRVEQLLLFNKFKEKISKSVREVQ